MANFVCPSPSRLAAIGVTDTPGGAALITALKVISDYINNNASIMPDVKLEMYPCPPSIPSPNSRQRSFTKKSWASPYSTVDTDNLFNTLYHVTDNQVQGVLGTIYLFFPSTPFILTQNHTRFESFTGVQSDPANCEALQCPSSEQLCSRECPL